MKKICAFTVADDNNLKYYEMMKNSLRKFHSEEELPLVLFGNKEILQTQDREVFYRASPLFLKSLLDNYETVVKLDCDQIITGNISHTSAARAALPRLTDEDLDAMRAAIDEMEALGDDVAEMAVRNRRFHMTLLEASGMSHLLHHVRLLWNASDHYRSVYYLDGAHRREVHADHRRIVEACVAHDEAVLIAALDEHRDHAIDGLRSTLEEDRCSTDPAWTRST